MRSPAGSRRDNIRCSLHTLRTPTLPERIMRLSLLLALTLTAGCRSAGTPTLASSIPAATGKVETMYALQFIELEMGTGTAAAAEKCFYAHYTGWLVDGTKFDSSRDTTAQGRPRTPIDFKQGARQVIPGWDSGFEGMMVGGKRRLLIPYQIAYGANGRMPTIPPRAMLVFDVELMDVVEPPSFAPNTPAAQQRCKPWDQRRS